MVEPATEMAALFDTSRTNIVEHLGHIYAEGELEKEATCRDFRQVRQEGKIQVNRLVPHYNYNLDAIISVGYRVKSATATQFRIWATKRLREYLVQGYSVNQQRLEQLGQIVEVMAWADNHLVAGTGEVLSAYIPSLQTLRDYDEGTLSDSESAGNAPVGQLTHADTQRLLLVRATSSRRIGFSGSKTGISSSRSSLPSIRVLRSTQPPSKRRRTYCTSWLKTTRWLMVISVAPQPCSSNFYPGITCYFRRMAHRSSRTTP